MKKLLLTLGIYSALIFIACIITSNCMIGNLPLLLDTAVKSYKFSRGLIWFFEFLPAVLLSGLLLAACIQWKSQTSSAATEKRFSLAQLRRFKKFFILALLLTLLLTVLEELLLPSIQKKQEIRENQIEYFNKSIDLANRLLYEDENSLLAAQYAEIAYSLNPHDERAIELYENTHDNLESTMAEIQEKKSEEKDLPVADEVLQIEDAVFNLSEGAGHVAPEADGLESDSALSSGVDVNESGDLILDGGPAVESGDAVLEDVNANEDDALVSSVDETDGNGDVVSNAADVKSLESSKKEDTLPMDATGYSSKELLELSERAAQNENWFDAHYWATLAEKVCLKTDTNYQIAVERANYAWSKISKPESFGNEDEKNYYKIKKDGYSALNDGDFMSAYYIFQELSEDPSHAEDPDVLRYFALAKEKVESQYFFIDESSKMETMICQSDIYYQIENSDGTKDIFFIGQSGKIREDGGYVRYLKDFNFTKFAKNGKALYSFYVPFVKAVALSANTFSYQQKNEMNISKKWKYLPLLYLKSVDRKSQGVVSEPAYEIYQKDFSVEKNNLLLLPMDFDDFDMLDSISAGADKMGIGRLYKFCKNPLDFGFAKSTYILSLASRITYPFLILILIIATGILAWNYGFANENSIFKFKYLFTMPLLFAIAFVLFEIIEYAFKLVNFLFVTVMGFPAIYLCLSLYAILLLVLCIIFVSRKNTSQ